jgi:chromosomal replication initiation ATPase DnaA
MIGPVSRIMEEVARKHGLTIEDLKKRTTSPRYAWPRQEVMYRCVTETKAPYRTIAAALGLKDHKSVVVGVPLHAERLVWLTKMNSQLSPMR